MEYCLTTDEAILHIILKVYDAMDEYDICHWSRKNAEEVVADQILMDKERGVDSLPYEAKDFYDTIKNLILMDYGRLRLFCLRIKQHFRR